MPRVALHTLGCKVNQYETQKIAEDFRSRGFELVDFSDEADVYVINTCTVTRTADGKSRRAARAAVGRNPGAKVIVTGCCVETSEGALRGIEGVSLVVGNREKEHLADQVAGRLSVPPLRQSAIRNPKSEMRVRTRALLKIQDGCDQFCAYCAVPLARPAMHSRPFDEALCEARDLARRGHKEIVLTGIRLGRYDFGLTELIRAISELQGVERIRLSSIELTDIPPDLLDVMASDGKVCRHLHVPLQSGDDGVLARMRRPYTAAEFEAFVTRIRNLVPEIGLTTDIMVGFPGETEAQFARTCELAERVRFSRIHVFPYSPRPGTAAFEMGDDVSPAEKARRKARVLDLGSRRMDEFAQRMIGTTVEVLAESGGSGLTDNYVRVAFRGDSRHVGEIVRVRVESVSRGVAHGRLVNAAGDGE